MYVKSNNNKLPTNLPQLQNLIKRDPNSYTEELDRQVAIYLATKNVFEQNPTVYNASLQELVMFFSQIAHCYQDRFASFPQDLVTVLEKHGTTLNADMRLAFVKALVLLRNKNLLSPTALLKLFFKLLRSQDKVLRVLLKEHIVTDIKNMNTKGKNMKLNNKLQNFMFDMLRDSHAISVKTSLDIIIDLYKKQVWNDAKTANIIASACFSKITKVMVAAVKFFVGRDENEKEQSSDSDSEDDVSTNVKKIRMAARVNKTKKSNKYQKMEAKAKLALAERKKKKKTKEKFDFSAIRLIHDPQTLADKLYKRLEKMNERFEVKLMVMNFVSRLIGIHELFLPNFYPYLQRYLFVHQREVTKIMTYAAQAAHPLVPPDDLEPIVRTLADNFVTERYSGEVMAMGINAIRELCARNSYCISEDLVQDLTAYKSHKDKCVNMASRSLIGLFREKNPQLLAKKDKGTPTELLKESKTKQYGELEALEFIPGAEILTLPMTDDGMQVEDSSDDEVEDEDDDTNARSSEVKPHLMDGKMYSKKEAVKEVMKMAAEERAQRAKEVLITRTLTDEDFARIEELQAAKGVERFSASKKRARKRQLEEQDQDAGGDIVKLSSIEMVHKKRCHDKETRLLSILEGREGRPKFGSKKGRLNPNASTTNREKSKSKTFMMMKHKIRHSKKRMNFREKQIKLKNALLKKKIK